MLSLQSALYLAPMLAALPALAAPAATPTVTLVVTDIVTQKATVTYDPFLAVITPYVQVEVPNWVKVQSDKTVQPWGGLGWDAWSFAFDSTYTSEAFAVTLWAEPSGMIANTAWTTNKPTATLSCNVHVTASPTDNVYMAVETASPWVATPTIGDAILTCATTT